MPAALYPIFKQSALSQSALSVSVVVMIIGGEEVQPYPDSGSVFYKDEYGVLYRTVWEKSQAGGVSFFDFTTMISSPRPFSGPSHGYISDKKLFRNGICTIIRQVIRSVSDGYEIVAEGQSQFECYVQYNFSCDDAPSDVFRYHLDDFLTEELEMISEDINESEITGGTDITSGTE